MFVLYVSSCSLRHVNGGPVDKANESSSLSGRQIILIAFTILHTFKGTSALFLNRVCFGLTILQGLEGTQVPFVVAVGYQPYRLDNVYWRNWYREVRKET